MAENQTIVKNWRVVQRMWNGQGVEVDSRSLIVIRTDDPVSTVGEMAPNLIQTV